MCILGVFILYFTDSNSNSVFVKIFLVLKVHYEFEQMVFFF